MTKRPNGDKSAKPDTTSESQKTDAKSTQTGAAQPAQKTPTAGDAKPAAPKAAEAKPAEKTAASKPADAKPADTKPTAKPADKPTSAGAAKPADKAAEAKPADKKADATKPKVIDAEVIDAKKDGKAADPKKPAPKKSSGGVAAGIAWVAVFLLIVGGLGYGTRHIWWQQGEPILAQYLPESVLVAIAPGGGAPAPVAVTEPAPAVVEPEPVEEEETLVEAIVEEVEEVADAVETAVDAVEEAAQPVVDEVVEETTELAAAVSEEVTETIEAAQEEVAEIVQDVETAAPAMEEEVTDIVEEAVEDAVEEVVEEASALLQDADEFAARIGAVEEGLGRLEGLIVGLNAKLDAQAGLAGRVDAAEASGQEALELVMAEKAALEDQVAALLQRLDDVESRVAETAELPAARQAQALNLAIGQLREATLREGGFELAVSNIAALGVDDSVVAGAVETLSAHAASGTQTLPTLQADFPEAAAAAARAELGSHEGDIVGSTVANLKRLVSFRRTDGVEDTSVDGLLAEAERALDENDLARAAAAVGKLDSPASDAAADWLSAAQARLAVDGAVATLTARSIELLGGGN